MRVAMLAYAFYEGNSRIQQYATALAKRGDTVDVFVLGPEGDPSFQVLNGVNVYQLQRRKYGSESQLHYLTQVGIFMLRSAYTLSKRHFARSYDVIHVHSVPDFLVFAAALPKASGASLVLDIHDILPEFYASKFGASNSSLIFRVLAMIEKISSGFSDHVIIANHIWYERLISRSLNPKKLTEITNYPNPDIFRPGRRNRSDNKFIVTYPGSLNRHQGVDIAIEAFARVSKEIPEAEYHIYGDGPERKKLENLVRELGVQDKVLFREFLPTDEIARVMANSDLAIVPKRTKASFGNEAASTKILEFMSVGVPVIVARTKIDTYYYDDSTVRFFNPEDVEDLANSILLLYKNRRLRDDLVRNALAYARSRSWSEKKKDYLDIVDSLASRKRPRDGGSATPGAPVEQTRNESHVKIAAR